uniref:Uncharacterized protein n=1 Tax=Mycena chlorophos TaxID=658473 RepID=A0ABQ0MDM0_MYCCL|nr:predicted protein [Mycena chlorophos]
MLRHPHQRSTTRARLCCSKLNTSRSAALQSECGARVTESEGAVDGAREGRTGRGRPKTRYWVGVVGFDVVLRSENTKRCGRVSLSPAARTNVLVLLGFSAPLLPLNDHPHLNGQHMHALAGGTHVDGCLNRTKKQSDWSTSNRRFLAQPVMIPRHASML